jgi:hypothetical protein
MSIKQMITAGLTVAAFFVLIFLLNSLTIYFHRDPEPPPWGGVPASTPEPIECFKGRFLLLNQEKPVPFRTQK